MPRGGHRENAGAPKGNLNALKHGRRTADPALHRLLSTTPPAARAALLDYLKSIKPSRQTIKQPPKQSNTTPSNLLSFPPPPTYTTTTTDIQSNLLQKLLQQGWVNPAPFIRTHPADAIHDAIALLEALPPDQRRTIRNPAGFLRALIHETISQPTHNLDGEPALECPYCGHLKPLRRTV